ncbi:MAG: Tol biopolymer transporter periplasmic protein [Cyanobacteria bacterium]|nr:Tol biopolymer transporter periplasmic protein [Cyanobacteriota bacterium]MDW8200147.1 Tol biopolymer transporter periplasmic protein [Cyanobacteriota bacterium SKYGB_h_bin112]
MKQIPLLALLTICLGGCVTPARLLTFPFDPGGRSLNSTYADQSPQMAGRYLIFVSDRRGSQDIYLYDLTTQRLIDLPGLNAPDFIASQPSISADGQFIVFTGIRQGISGIYLYNRNTRQLRNLTASLRAAVRNPSISADGRRIAFESSVNGQWDVVVYDRAGQPIAGL